MTATVPSVSIPVAKPEPHSGKDPVASKQQVRDPAIYSRYPQPVRPCRAHGAPDPRRFGRQAHDRSASVSATALQPDQYRDDSQNTCLSADRQGVCMARPQACPQVYPPVCACDGNVYGNECSANAAGFDTQGWKWGLTML